MDPCARSWRGVKRRWRRFPRTPQNCHTAASPSSRTPHTQGGSLPLIVAVRPLRPPRWSFRGRGPSAVSAITTPPLAILRVPPRNGCRCRRPHFSAVRRALEQRLTVDCGPRGPPPAARPRRRALDRVRSHATNLVVLPLAPRRLVRQTSEIVPEDAARMIFREFDKDRKCVPSPVRSLRRARHRSRPPTPPLLLGSGKVSADELADLAFELGGASPPTRDPPPPPSLSSPPPSSFPSPGSACVDDQRRWTRSRCGR